MQRSCLEVAALACVIIGGCSRRAAIEMDVRASTGLARTLEFEGGKLTAWTSSGKLLELSVRGPQLAQSGRPGNVSPECHGGYLQHDGGNSKTTLIETIL